MQPSIAPDVIKDSGAENQDAKDLEVNKQKNMQKNKSQSAQKGKTQQEEKQGRKVSWADELDKEEEEKQMQALGR